MPDTNCIHCNQTPWTAPGDAPRCAFPAGVFCADNWNCALVAAIRDLVCEDQPSLPTGVTYQYCSDQKYATLNVSDVFLDDAGEPIALTLWLTWYKNRGTTEQMWLLSERAAPRRPTEQETLAILAHYQAP